MTLETLEFLFGLVLLIFAGGLGFLILIKIIDKTINLSRLISEPNGDASMSRFQFLIFTFVIALSLFIIVLGQKPTPDFPKTFPPEILILLGISAGSYVVSKGIQFSSSAGIAQPALTIAPVHLPLVAGQVVNFTASVVNVPAGTPLPQVTWSVEAPAQGTITTAGVYTAPNPLPGGGLRDVVHADASGFEGAKIALS